MIGDAAVQLPMPRKVEPSFIMKRCAPPVLTVGASSSTAPPLTMHRPFSPITPPPCEPPSASVQPSRNCPCATLVIPIRLLLEFDIVDGYCTVSRPRPFFTSG